MANFPDPPFRPDDFTFGGGAEAETTLPTPAFDPLDHAIATGDYLVRKADLESDSTGEADTTKRANDDAAISNLIGKSAERFQDPAQGRAFAQWAIDDAAPSMKQRAEEWRKREQLENATQTLGRLRDAALRLPDDAGKARLIDTSRSIFGALEGKGYLTPDEAQKRARSWVQDYAVQALKVRPAQEQLETLRSLADGTAGPASAIFGLIPQEQRERLQREADREATIAAVRGAVEKAEKWKRDIIDASEDLRNIPRMAIENDPELDGPNRDLVLRAYNEAQAKAASFDDALRRFRAGEAFSPESEEDRRNADKLYGFFGGDETAARVVYSRTGIVPPASIEQSDDEPGAAAAERARPGLLQLASLGIPEGISLPDDGAVTKPEPFTREALVRDVEKVSGAEPRMQTQDHSEPVRVAQNVQPGKIPANHGSPNNGWKQHPFEEKIENNTKINDIIEREAKAVGVNPRWLKIVAYIESEGGKKKDKKGASFIGLFQFGDDAWKRFGKGGDRSNPVHSTRAAIREFEVNRTLFVKRMSREPTLGEIYLMHQQGGEGALAHMKNPNGLAWVNLLPTAKTESTAKERIRQNLETNLRSDAYVNQLTSQEFMDYWLKKVEGGEGYGNWFMAFPAGRTSQIKGTATNPNGMPIDRYPTPSMPNASQQDRRGADTLSFHNSDAHALSAGWNAIAADTMLRNANKFPKWPR